MIISGNNEYDVENFKVQEQPKPDIGDYIAGPGNTRGGICAGFRTEIVPESYSVEGGAIIPEHSYEVMNLVTQGVVYVTPEQAVEAINSGYWYYDLTKSKSSFGGLSLVAITSESQNLDKEMVSLPKEQYDLLIETIKFYASPKSYKHLSLEVMREKLGGKDPSISMSTGGNFYKAPSGFALSEIQHDNNGDKARATLKILEEDNE